MKTGHFIGYEAHYVTAESWFESDLICFHMALPHSPATLPFRIKIKIAYIFFRKAHNCT